MKVALQTRRHANLSFFLLPVLILFMHAPFAQGDDSACADEIDRITIKMKSMGDAGVCRNQQQILDSFDFAATGPCAYGRARVAIDGLKSQIMAKLRQNCPSVGGTQGGGYEPPAPPASYDSPPPVNAALHRARADGDRADQFLKDMQKCDQISDPDPRSACRFATTKAYQGNGSGGAKANSRTGGKGGSSGTNGPDEDPNQQPKALPPPKDPGVDYSGQSCSYFTRPAVEDEVRLNYYAKGSCVSYGQSSYECGDDGRWKRRGPAEVIKCKTAEESEGSSGEPLGRWYIPKDGEVRDPFRGM